ncbi:DUF1415 domain-containing protein [Methylibium sp.]|uniref:DUF1415 domain-containing protein n=1 Tax=Methylibium sp. TaxID=2067992 RepID=UPI00286A3918|nr:DUF1415 domain-containing protein [Methylibium sp.]
MNPDPTAVLDPIAHTRAWVERAVIGLNLCPFARAVQVKQQVRYLLCVARDTDTLLAVLCDEMRLLVQAEPAQIETSLLIHPHVLGDFADFNDFLGVADAALAQLGLAGVLQVASFHPDYRFAATEARDLGNATNRSPYPTLHLLREASVERAVQAFPEADAIYENNIRRLRALGPRGWAELQAQCVRDAHG